MAIGALNDEVLDVRAVELDRAVDQIVEARRALRDAEADGARPPLAFTAAMSPGLSAQHVRSYCHLEPACSAASRFAVISPVVQ